MKIALYNPKEKFLENSEISYTYISRALLLHYQLTILFFLDTQIHSVMKQEESQRCRGGRVGIRTIFAWRRV